ncbi:MAG: hypothetical protein AAGG01_20330, partial [Planctomycetota bacterium]
SMAAAAGLHVRPCWTCCDLGSTELQAPAGHTSRAESLRLAVRARAGAWMAPRRASLVDANMGRRAAVDGGADLDARPGPASGGLRRAPIAQLLAVR